jgi:hypothetical protein
VLGRKLEDLFPVAFLPANHALAIAIMSYNGGIDFGLLGDYDALPDIDVIADGIAESLAELLEVARGGKSAASGREPTSAAAADASSQDRTEPHGEPSPSNGGPAPFIPKDHARPKRGPAADMRAKRQRGSRPARKRSDS